MNQLSYNADNTLKKRIVTKQVLIDKTDFTGSDIRQCSSFGCQKYLTLTEQLCGNLCLEHMNIKPINITNIIFKK